VKPVAATSTPSESSVIAGPAAGASEALGSVDSSVAGRDAAWEGSPEAPGEAEESASHAARTIRSITSGAKKRDTAKNSLG
jgi:hypothetical protein